MKFFKTDIDLICELDSYTYVQTMKGVVSENEQQQFKLLKDRLQSLSDKYKEKYDDEAGIFKSEKATGNPISYHGNLRRVWSGIYKGTENKQYAAQISFVINIKDKCLDVGFYFGRAGSFNIDKDIRQKWFAEAKELGRLLYNQILSNLSLREEYDTLFELGFKAEIKEKRVTSEEWLNNLLVDPIHSSVIFNLKPDQNGEIESQNIDLYVSMLIPLISVLPTRVSETVNKKPDRLKIKSLSPEQRAKQAEKRALIGLAGEKYVMDRETKNLMDRGLNANYPIHKSLISDSYGYDILSFEPNSGNEIYIEVKTTTLLKNEKSANIFFISSQEYAFYESNKDKYRLYRVYDIYGAPNYEVLDLSQMKRFVDKYKMEY